MILHIIPDYFNTRLYQLMLEALQSISPNRTYKAYVCANTKNEHANLPQYIYQAGRSFSNLERLLFFPKQRYLLRDIEKQVSMSDVSCIHAHTLFSSGYLAYRLHKKYGIPYIIAIRNTDVNIFFKYMPHLRCIGQRIAEHASRIIYISPAYQRQVEGRYLSKLTANKATVIPNGIDDIFLQNCSQHQRLNNTIRIIYIGRIEKAKNIKTLIRVVDTMVKQGKSVRLSLVGSIIDSNLKPLIESRKANIEWYPQCDKQQVLTHLRQNDIFMMPSFRETFGLVYVEAMSQGLPVIYTKGQGIDGFFEDGKVGYAVPAKDVNYIINRVDDILKEYKKISDNCVHEAKNFNWLSVAEQYDKIYQSIQKK